MIVVPNIARPSTTRPDDQKGVAEASRPTYEESLDDAGFGPVTTEVSQADEFYYAEDYHQQYLAKNPGGYCGIGGTGVTCQVGSTQ